MKLLIRVPKATRNDVDRSFNCAKSTASGQLEQDGPGRRAPVSLQGAPGCTGRRYIKRTWRSPWSISRRTSARAARRFCYQRVLCRAVPAPVPLVSSRDYQVPRLPDKSLLNTQLVSPQHLTNHSRRERKSQKIRADGCTGDQTAPSSRLSVQPITCGEMNACRER